MKALRNLTPAKKKDYIVIAAFAAIVLVLAIVGWINHRPAANVNYDMKLKSGTALESHMLIGGDIYWGRRMNDWSMQSPLKEAYPFSRLQEFEREKYDAWIGNLECPTVPDVKEPVSDQVDLHGFNCETRYLPEFKKWFDIVSLGNNHSSNQQREMGLLATRKTLDEARIQHFGGFDPHKTSENCSVVAMPTRAVIDGKQQEVKMPVAMCGYHGAYYTITDKAVAEMEQYAKFMPVIAMPHAGREYTATADQERREIYQKMIDHGADMVIGNHPHWVQPTEAYKGKLIVYSMGNFIFDQQFSPEVMRSAAIDTTFTVDQNTVTAEQLNAWTKLGETCGASNDDCLKQAKEQKLERLNVKIAYDIVGVDLSSQITHRANQRLEDEILTRLNWHDTISKLAK